MSNLIAAYAAVDEDVVTSHRQGTYEESEALAQQLITNVDLSLVFRARAMVLRCGSAPSYLEHA